MKQVITLTESDIRHMVAEALLEAENNTNDNLEDVATQAIAQKAGISGGLAKKAKNTIKTNSQKTNLKANKQKYDDYRSNGESRGKAVAHIIKGNAKETANDLGEFYQDLTPMEKAELAAIIMESINAMNL